MELMGTKSEKGLCKAYFPPEIWTNIFEFLRTAKLFYLLYTLNKELHNYPWKNILAQQEFRMKQEIESLEYFDFSYVSSLDLGESSQISDEGLSHLKGIHTLDLKWCEQISDKGLEHLKGIHTLNLTGCSQITDNGLGHLKGIHTLDLYNCS
jgi:hypothetical protein